MDQSFNKFCKRIRHICACEQNVQRQSPGWDYRGCQSLCSGVKADPWRGSGIDVPAWQSTSMSRIQIPPGKPGQGDHPRESAQLGLAFPCYHLLVPRRASPKGCFAAIPEQGSRLHPRDLPSDTRICLQQGQSAGREFIPINNSNWGETKGTAGVPEDNLCDCIGMLVTNTIESLGTSKQLSLFSCLLLSSLSFPCRIDLPPSHKPAPPPRRKQDMKSHLTPEDIQVKTCKFLLLAWKTDSKQCPQCLDSGKWGWQEQKKFLG